MSQSNGIPASVRVDIFDQSYHLRGTDTQYIAELAEYVDTKMRMISKQASTVESLKVAVLAALNIADEYHMLKKKYEAATSDYSVRAGHLSDALDEILEEPRRAG